MIPREVHPPVYQRPNSVTLYQRRNVARAYVQTIVLLLPILIFYWAIPLSDKLSSLYSASNGTVPIYFCAVLILLAVRVLKEMPDALWSAVFWFPVQAAVFYGFGPLVEIYGNMTTQFSLAVHALAVDEIELFRAHKLSTTGIACVLLAFYIHYLFRPNAWTHIERSMASNVSLAFLGILSVLLGGVFKYLVLLPSLWGLSTLTVAGVLSVLGNLIDLGFAILAFVIANGGRQHRLFFWLFWPLHLVLSLLTFSKTAVVLAMLLPLLGGYLARRRRGRLLFGLLVIALVYAFLQPFVHYGRSEVYAISGTINHAGYGKRAQILQQYIVSDDKTLNTDASRDERQGWWTRLNFAGPQAKAMALYDSGDANPTLGRAWMYFVPRAIWSNKPIMVGPGKEFNRMVTGNQGANSFLALSIYGDLYWQYGWPGVIIGSLLIGLILAELASQSVRVVRERNFIMLPVAFMALEMALLGPNKYVLNGVIGPLPIYLAFYFFLGWVSRSFRVRQGVHAF